MPDFRNIPIVEIGPGTQASAAEDGLEYLAMPSAMQTYRAPLLPEPEDSEGLDQAHRLLAEVLSALAGWQPGDRARRVELDGLDTANRHFVDQVLGEGEVSVAYAATSPVRAQESVLAGVWRVQHLDRLGRVLRDTIEIGDVPELVRDATFVGADSHLDSTCDTDDPALQNAPALLVELADQLTGWRVGDPVHSINLSLLPHSDADLALLGERLGVGPVTILSRGYGNCRIGSTAMRNTWWIKYYNSQDALILNTIEVCDVPAVAQAAAEDIADSVERLDEILALYRRSDA